jgi:formiminotetrahydrofolate cyclodeaminase
VERVEAVLLRERVIPDPYLDLSVGELLDSVADRGGPGAGAVAAIGAAAAAALVELAARATDKADWPEAPGAAAQARKLRERLVRQDAEAYEAAVARLDDRGDDFALGEALALAADIPLEIADHAENVAGLAADAAARAAGEVRADASAAAALALGAAWAAAKLVEVNLAMREDDPRLAKARAIAAGVTETARIALTSDG